MPGYPRSLFLEPNLLQLPSCALCSEVPKEPYKLSCAHDACYSCLTGDVRICQLCRDEVHLNDDPTQEDVIPPFVAAEAMLNDHLKRLIDQLDIRCSHQGCLHNQVENPIKVIDFDRHEANCDYRILTCEVCHKEMTFMQLKIHRTSQHPVEDECEVCLRIIPPSQRMEHVLYELGICTTSYNGWFIWPVNGLTEAREQAMDRVARAIRSQAFFTSPNGYTLCVILYLDGNDEGLHTHISVYVAVMCGQFDNLLAWPFNQKISLTLRNLANPDNNITRIINPQDYPQCFTKPSRFLDMSDKAGFPMFALQREVFSAGSGFIDKEDDAMFLEVNVDPLP